MSTPTIALVTGASRGIGAAISDTLARHDMVTIGTATSQQGADLISERLQQIQADSFGLVLNVTDDESIKDCLNEIKHRCAAPTVLVNNAGITQDNLVMRMSDEEWQQVIDTNLTANFKLIKASIRHMLKVRQGCIINIGSVVGSSGNAGQANYAAAKAGLIGMTKSLARELGNRNIRVNCVAPGFIETDMTKQLDDQQRTLLQQQIPLNRLGQPQDVADAVLFLAKYGQYITGQTVHVNGGMYLP